MENYIEIFRHISDKSIKYDNYTACRTQLPTRSNHDIKWTSTIGYIFDFSYQGFNGYLTIVDYDILKSRFYFTINNSDIVYSVGIRAFKNTGFKEIIRIRYHDYNIGEIINNKKILGVSYSCKNKSIIYKYKCLNDGYVGEAYQFNIIKNTGLCPVCTNHVIMIGCNDIPTTDPWMIDYFKGGYDEAKLYVAQSAKVIEMKCPHCGKLKKTAISDVYRNKGMFCQCSDKVSYPEKSMINLLDILNIDYVYQCTNTSLDWVGTYRYDFYIPSLNIIIETHGGQHYKELSEQSKWSSLETIQKRDLHKKNLAINNDIKHYIELDCSESKIEKFKESIMNSDLPFILDFKGDDIDWNKIDQLSARNIVKEVCLYKEEHPYLTPAEVADKFHISKRTPTTYYKIGEKFGWCTYNKDEIRWVSHFHRNTHYCIDGIYFYNVEDITSRSMNVFGEKIHGGSIATYIRKSTKKLFNNKYKVRTVSHKEYLIKNQIYPSYISQKIIDGLLLKYN